MVAFPHKDRDRPSLLTCCHVDAAKEFIALWLSALQMDSSDPQQTSSRAPIMTCGPELLQI